MFFCQKKNMSLCSYVFKKLFVCYSIFNCSSVFISLQRRRRRLS